MVPAEKQGPLRFASDDDPAATAEDLDVTGAGLAEQVIEAARTSLLNQGLDVDTFQIKEIADDKGYITPKEAQGEFPVFVSRIRNDPTVEHGLSLWVVSDNLRKGAALNAVQIAEKLVSDYLSGKAAA